MILNPHDLIHDLAELAALVGVVHRIWRVERRVTQQNPAIEWGNRALEKQLADAGQLAGSTPGSVRPPPMRPQLVTLTGEQHHE